jgi:hypothetical protein
MDPELRERIQDRIARRYLERRDREDFERRRAEDLATAPDWTRMPPLPRTITALARRVARPPALLEDGWLVYTELLDRNYLAERRRRRALVASFHPDRGTAAMLTRAARASVWTKRRWRRRPRRNWTQGAWRWHEARKAYEQWELQQLARYALLGIDPPEG